MAQLEEIIIIFIAFPILIFKIFAFVASTAGTSSIGLALSN